MTLGIPQGSNRIPFLFVLLFDNDLKLFNSLKCSLQKDVNLGRRYVH
jgi:hypothetical protein